MNYEEFKENLANDVKEQMESKFGSEVTVETRRDEEDEYVVHLCEREGKQREIAEDRASKAYIGYI